MSAASGDDWTPPRRASQVGPVIRWIREGAVLPIRVYQRWISPFTPPTCRFRPTCSGYALEAIRTRGLWIGGFLALRRILRCHPFSEPGFDPVPPPRPPKHPPC